MKKSVNIAAAQQGYWVNGTQVLKLNQRRDRPFLMTRLMTQCWMEGDRLTVRGCLKKYLSCIKAL
ncbi:MAG: hypothetical protein IGR76_02005 [Synechococcales cyanobacterium T60_A2020_003]|nr:hypothetical protein [Synechococcales cyanobacterium T60_A2020_003]